MNKKYSFSEKFRYFFENTLSAGTSALIGWLAVLSFGVVLITGAIVALTGISPEGSEPLNFVEGAWQSLMRTMDAGTIGGDSGWSFRLIMFVVTIGGIFIFSALIGILTSGLEQKMEQLRKGRSKVLETNHTLILGWSSKIFPIISELIIANSNQKKPRIVIMADKDKVEMEDEIGSKNFDLQHTKIICRTGSPLDLNDLKVVNPNGAKSIIILSPEEHNADTFVIKSVLALTNNPERRSLPYHIVAEIENLANMEAATLVGGNEAVYIHSSDLIARVTAQTCRQSGLSIVYTELLDFGGDEIYFKNEKSLAGQSFKNAIFAYNSSSIIGLMNETGNVTLNPAMDTVLTANDQIIAIAEDDDKIKLSGLSNFNIKNELISSLTKKSEAIEKTLILGWNEKGPAIIQELENYVAVGSEILIMAENKEIADEIIELRKTIKKQTIQFKLGNTTDRKTLNEINISTYNYIIILCYPEMDIQEADAKTLIALLHIRNICDLTGTNPSIVSEMLDIKNRELAEVTKADDFIISDKLTSLMISQLSENKNLKKVFEYLFSAEGSEIYLKPVSNYVKSGEKTNFYTILESASIKNEVAFGYKIESKSDDASAQYGVVVNPDKLKEIVFSPEDKIIVLAED
ncbi:MAG TPA: potassium transporter TrkA [Bacteroidales bacterium]|nr:MAG: potassium transporter TrkA [Bacteroidetes bacterium GWF2_33_38]HBF89392.1 potassium transporter TrkA [Bacteroidales bacterium]